MSKKTGKRGRPPADNPKSDKVNFRLDVDLAEGIEKWRVQNNLEGTSIAIRHALRTLLKDRGVMK